jgi:hypothetical protein
MGIIIDFLWLCLVLLAGAFVVGLVGGAALLVLRLVWKILTWPFYRWERPELATPPPKPPAEDSKMRFEREMKQLTERLIAKGAGSSGVVVAQSHPERRSA